MKILITEKQAEIKGETSEVLAGLSMLIRALKEDIPEKIIRNSIELGFKSDEEINKKVEDILEKKEKLFELLGKLGIDVEED